jgi:hypothetical protein
MRTTSVYIGGVSKLATLPLDLCKKRMQMDLLGRVCETQLNKNKMCFCVYYKMCVWV